MNIPWETVSNLVRLSTFKITVGPIWPWTRNISAWLLSSIKFGSLVWETAVQGLLAPAVFGVPSPCPDLWASVPGREVLVFPEGKRQASLFFCTVPTHQQMNNNLIDFLYLGAPIIQEFHVCLQKSPAVWAPAVLPHHKAALLGNLKRFNYFTGKTVIHE